MAGNITFSMIKPCAFTKGDSGAIISMITKGGFKLLAMKLIVMDKKLAAKFYEVHKERSFYNDLVEFMISGPVVAMLLEKDNAVSDFRAFIGSTDPLEAANGTIRKIFGQNLQKNAIHASDSDENASRESNFFFSEFERFNW